MQGKSSQDKEAVQKARELADAAANDSSGRDVTKLVSNPQNCRTLFQIQYDYK